MDTTNLLDVNLKHSLLGTHIFCWFLLNQTGSSKWWRQIAAILNIFMISTWMVIQPENFMHKGFKFVKSTAIGTHKDAGNRDLLLRKLFAQQNLCRIFPYSSFISIRIHTLVNMFCVIRIYENTSQKDICYCIYAAAYIVDLYFHTRGFKQLLIWSSFVSSILYAIL